MVAVISAIYPAGAMSYAGIGISCRPVRRVADEQYEHDGTGYVHFQPGKQKNSGIHFLKIP